MQTMGEFASLTERLALMADPALQQFAQMHKDDPFTLALAVSESNRRKKVRTAQQGVAGMQPQPPVADQEIAQMAAPAMPENVGIGALSAPALAGMPAGGIAGEDEAPAMAGGGLVAFADGGNVERYQVGGATSLLRQFLQATGQTSAYANGTPSERAAIETAFRAATQGPAPAAPAAATPAAATPATPAAATPATSRLATMGLPAAILYGGSQLSGRATDVLAGATPEQRQEFFSSPMMGAMSGDAGLAAAILNEGAASAAAGEKKAATAFRARLDAERARNMEIVNEDRHITYAQKYGAPTAPVSTDFRSRGIRSDTAVPGTSNRSTNPRAVPGAGAPGAGVPGAGVASDAGAAPRAGGFDMTPSGLMALRKKLGEDIQLEEPKNIREAREALSKEELEAKQASKAAIERDQAKFADAFKGREERLGKREAEIGKQRGENTGLAFLNAGLAIMSTPGGLATALGKGARVGTEQYASGLEKLRSAQEKLDEARDRLEDLKLNRAEMNAKEIRDAEAGINTAKIAARQRGVEALTNMYNISNKRADAMFNTLGEVGTTIYREQQANVRNAASVAATRDAAAASREATTQRAAEVAQGRMAALAETMRKNIAAEALKQYGADAQAAYIKNATEAAIRANPALAEYMGAAGGGGAPAAAPTMRFNPATGQIEPVR
jgi:hypothetical protein